MLWLDCSIFAGWDIAIDDRDTGLWLTGFMVAGMTVPWRAMFGFLTHDRAASDETLGQHSPVIKRAA